MPPPTEFFSAKELPYRMQLTDDGRLRKGGQQLQECELMRMMSYACDVGKDAAGRRIEGGIVWCNQIPRLFRRCADGLTVETTAWEQTEFEDVWKGAKRWDKTRGGLVETLGSFQAK